MQQPPPPPGLQLCWGWLACTCGRLPCRNRAPDPRRWRSPLATKVLTPPKQDVKILDLKQVCPHAMPFELVLLPSLSSAWG